LLIIRAVSFGFIRALAFNGDMQRFKHDRQQNALMQAKNLAEQ